MLNGLSSSLKPPFWPHWLLPKANSFPDSWDSFFMITVTTFPDNWNSLFRIVMTIDLVAWTSLIFPYLAKTKTNYWNYFSLAKMPSFFVTFSLVTLTWNSKNTLKLNIPFFAKILRWILGKFIAVWDRFWLILFAKIPH